MAKEETMAAPFTPFSSYQSCSYCIPLLKNTSTIVRTSSVKFENGTWSFTSQCLQEDSIFSHVILVTVMYVGVLLFRWEDTSIDCSCLSFRSRRN